MDDHKQRFHHEVMTAKLILNKRGEIYPILKENNINPEDVAALIDKNNPLLKKNRFGCNN